MGDEAAFTTLLLRVNHIRAEDITLTALDAQLGVPLRHLHRDVALLVGGGAYRPGAVGGLFGVDPDDGVLPASAMRWTRASM